MFSAAPVQRHDGLQLREATTGRVHTARMCAAAAATPELGKLREVLGQAQVAHGCADVLDGDRRAQLLHGCLPRADALRPPCTQSSGKQLSAQELSPLTLYFRILSTEKPSCWQSIYAQSLPSTLQHAAARV